MKKATQLTAGRKTLAAILAEHKEELWKLLHDGAGHEGHPVPLGMMTPGKFRSLIYNIKFEAIISDTGVLPGTLQLVLLSLEEAYQAEVVLKDLWDVRDVIAELERAEQEVAQAQVA